MNEGITNPVCVIRSARRVDLQDLRNRHKEYLLCNKRLRLNEVFEHVHDISPTEFKELLRRLKQKNVPLDILKKIKNSCVTDDYIEVFFRDEGAFISLLRVVIGNDAQKQLEATACLTNLACGSHKCSYKVAKAAGVYLISFLNGSNYFLQDQSSWALANIANDCFECFNVIKSQGVLPALHKALTSPISSVIQSVVFALNACTKYEDPEVLALTQKESLNLLLSVIDDDKINKYFFLDAAFAFSNCCFLSVKYNLNILNNEIAERVIKTLVRLINVPDIDIIVVTPLVRAIGFLSYDDKICEFLATHIDFYKSFQVITSSKNYTHLIKEALWVLSNVSVSAVMSCNNPNVPQTTYLENLFKTEKSLTLQLLYHLLISLSNKKSVSFESLSQDTILEIKSLSECEENNMSKAARIFLEFCRNKETLNKIQLD